METTQASLNDFFAPWKVGFEKSAALWARQFETAERIGSANVSAFRSVFETSSGRKPGDSKEEDFLAVCRSLAQMMAEAAAAYPSTLYRLVHEANEEASTLALKYLNKWSDLQVGSLDKMADKAPGGFDAVFKAMSQLVNTAAANQAYLLETMLSQGSPVAHEGGKGRRKNLPAMVESE